MSNYPEVKLSATFSDLVKFASEETAMRVRSLVDLLIDEDIDQEEANTIVGMATILAVSALAQIDNCEIAKLSSEILADLGIEDDEDLREMGVEFRKACLEE